MNQIFFELIYREDDNPSEFLISLTVRHFDRGIFVIMRRASTEIKSIIFSTIKAATKDTLGNWPKLSLKVFEACQNNVMN